MFTDEYFHRRADRRGFLAMFIGLAVLLLGSVGLGIAMNADCAGGPASPDFSFSVREASPLPLEFEQARLLLTGGKLLGREDIDLSQPVHWFKVKLYADETYWIDLGSEDAAVTGVWNDEGRQVLDAAALRAGIPAVGTRLVENDGGCMRVEHRDVRRVEFSPPESGYHYIEMRAAAAEAGNGPESCARR